MFQVEPLEERDLFAINLSPAEQLYLELTNRARMNPAAEAARFGIDLNEGLPAGTISAAPKQPLAPNNSLSDAIRKHVQELIDFDFFSHSGRNGSSVQNRVEAQGYTNWTGLGENLAYKGTTGPVNLTQFVTELHEGLFVDEQIANRGHRVVMLTASYKELGSGVVTGDFQGFNAAMIGQDFGSRSGNAFLTGVAYTDLVTTDNFYTPGEGIGGVVITATGTAGTFSTTSGAAGGYALPLPAGTYSVTVASTALGGTRVYAGVNVGTTNAKLDFTPGNAPATPVIPDPVPTTAIDSSFFNAFTGPRDVVAAGPTVAGSSAASVVLVNGDPAPGETFVARYNPLTNASLGTPLAAASVDLNGWSDVNDVNLVGDVDGDGVVELIQFNRPAAGAPLAGPAIRVVNLQSGAVTRTFAYGDTTNAGPLAAVLADLVDPADRVFVGHFTRTDHLEALFFNRDRSQLNAVALRAIDLVTGDVTFSSLHDGNIFNGWLDAADEYVISDVNSDGFQDLVIFNRVADPTPFRQTNIGFVGMVSIRDLGGPAGPYRGFFRFFDWNFAAPGENSVFPGYDDLTDRAVVGSVINNGVPTPVILLVNSSSQTQAAYAVLEPRPIVPGQRDSFKLLSTIMHGATNAGSFDPDDTLVMADFDGDGTDDVGSFNRSGSANFRAFSAFTGNVLGRGTSSRAAESVPVGLLSDALLAGDEETVAAPLAAAIDADLDVLAIDPRVADAVFSSRSRGHGSLLIDDVDLFL